MGPGVTFEHEMFPLAKYMRRVPDLDIGNQIGNTESFSELQVIWKKHNMEKRGTCRFHLTLHLMTPVRNQYK